MSGPTAKGLLRRERRLEWSASFSSRRSLALGCADAHIPYDWSFVLKPGGPRMQAGVCSATLWRRRGCSSRTYPMAVDHEDPIGQRHAGHVFAAQRQRARRVTRPGGVAAPAAVDRSTA